MNKELLNAYHHTVNFFAAMYGDDFSAYVADMIENPDFLLEDVRQTAARYGCTRVRSSFNEECVYLFETAERSLSALIAAENN